MKKYRILIIEKASGVGRRRYSTEHFRGGITLEDGYRQWRVSLVIRLTKGKWVPNYKSLSVTFRSLEFTSWSLRV